jgi:menaquinone-dependent protoporphyrinogen oxidase
MTNKILVTYASRTGSTAEVAEAICRSLVAPTVMRTHPAGIENLGENSLEVEVLPMQEVKDLAAYDAVVAGSAIRAARWLPEAVQFIRAHQSTLRHKPFAMYTVCITLAMSNGEQYRSAVSGWTAPVRAIVPPLSEGLFAGMLNFKKLPFNWETLKLRATVALGVFPRGDRRDWNAIRAWAESLKPMLFVTAH